MMKVFIAFIFSIICSTAFAQKADNSIVIGRVDTVYSKILNEKRIILVHVPGGDKAQHYPVLYILDGESHFNSAVAITEQLSGTLPPMIVIGITNTVRDRDLTPTHINAGRNVTTGEASISGGGENFIKFIETELIPYVNAKYPATSYRVLSGHSLGGLTVINTLINHTALFNAYIAIDPSLWWDDEKWVNKIENDLPNHKFVNTGLFIAIANDLPPEIDTIALLKDTANLAPITHALMPFVQKLRKTDPQGLRWSSKFYPNEWHGVVELNAEYDALRYLFNFYHFDMNQFITKPDLNADSLITIHYERVSAILGYKMLPRESNINNLAYYFLGRSKMDNAYALFKRNIINYPNSSSAYDGLGDYYVAKGEKRNAIEAFTQSLSLKETKDARAKLNELKKQ
jgi:predicted alpha/beta superfamily hydrolase